MTSHRLQKLQQKWPLILYSIEGALKFCPWYASIGIDDLKIELESFKKMIKMNKIKKNTMAYTLINI